MLSEREQHAVARGLRGGGREAWAALYDAYGEEVWRYVARLIGARSADVADVVQETFLAAARSARQFDPDRGSLWSWLTGIAHHQVAACWRSSQRAQRVVQLAEAGKLNSGGDDGQSVDGSMQQRELADAVRSVLAEMPADYASLLIGKYLDERSIDEIAAQCASSGEAVKSKLARARREFRTKFELLEKQSVTKTL